MAIPWIRNPAKSSPPPSLAVHAAIRENAFMPIYVYETTDDAKPARHFEIQQSMKDAPLTKHPETGEPIRRVISGGFGYMAKGNAPRHADMQRNMGGGSCRTGCGCHSPSGAASGTK